MGYRLTYEHAQRIRSPVRGVFLCGWEGTVRAGDSESTFQSGVFHQLGRMRIARIGTHRRERCGDLKFVLPRVSPSRVERLRREARAMAAESHPNLALIRQQKPGEERRFWCLNSFLPERLPTVYGRDH